MEESARLKAAYPGGNAEHITTQQNALAEAWQDLQDATVERRDLLKASYDLHRFNVYVILRYLNMKFFVILCYAILLFRI